jgi:hypothetical protein
MQCCKYGYLLMFLMIAPDQTPASIGVNHERPITDLSNVPMEESIVIALSGKLGCPDDIPNAGLPGA